MNVTLHHEIPFILTLAVAATVGLFVVLTVVAIRMLDYIESIIVGRALKREADEILDRVGAVPRGFGNPGSGGSGVGAASNGMAERY
jgi:uncharacterized membrane protein